MLGAQIVFTTILVIALVYILILARDMLDFNDKPVAAIITMLAIPVMMWIYITNFMDAHKCVSILSAEELSKKGK
jgi:hypothetical protein